MIRAGDNFYSRHHSPFTDNMLSQLKLSVINRLKSPKSIDYKSIPWPNFFMERGEFLSEAILSNQNHSIEDRAKNLINALKEANRIEQIYLPKHNAYIKAISLKSNPKNSIDMRKQLYRFIDGNFNYQSQDLFRRDLSIRDMKVQVMETLNSSQHTSFYNWLVEENFVHDPRALQQINDKKSNNSQISRPQSWAQFQDLPSEQTIYCSHGGGFFFLSDFLSKNRPGYRLEYEGRGIQIHPRTGPEQFWNISRESREEYYSSSSHAYGDYPARLSFEIQGQYLDRAPNCYEAGLRQDFIDHMQNIKLLNTETNEIIEAKDYESFIEMINFNANTHNTVRDINSQVLLMNERTIIKRSNVDKQVNKIPAPEYKKTAKDIVSDLVHDKNLDPGQILDEAKRILIGTNSNNEIINLEDLIMIDKSQTPLKIEFEDGPENNSSYRNGADVTLAELKLNGRTVGTLNGSLDKNLRDQLSYNPGPLFKDINIRLNDDTIINIDVKSDKNEYGHSIDYCSLEFPFKGTNLPSGMTPTVIKESDVDKQVNQIAEPKYKNMTKHAVYDLVHDKNLDPEKILENKDEIIKQLDKFAELDIDLNGQDSTVSPEIKEEFIALLDTTLELIAKGQDSALKKLNDQDQPIDFPQIEKNPYRYPYKANKANVLIDTIFLLTGLNKYPNAEKQASHNDRVVPILMRVASQL